jgi:site-specific DNA-methyltransferase (adenine-specific)
LKCAFEDAGFDIVEEIDWIYFTGFPKNQDIGKLFDKREGKKREVLKTIDKLQSFGYKGNRCYGGDIDRGGKMDITTPSSDLAKQWDGWKTAGLKPAKEPITVFQKPLEGTYCDNIEKWGCGGMNIDACRIPVNPEIDDMLKETIRQKRITETWEDGSGFKNENNPFTGVRPEGRFPPNIIFDEETRKLLDEQSGIKQSKRSMRGIGYSYSQVYGTGDKDFDTERGYNDIGGGSRFFYCAKPSPKEKILVDGSKNPHITVKPISLYKWLIKLVTPKDGTTIDITAGSCTHGIACEELNRDEGYKLKWMNIELLNTEKEPYCNFAKKRIQDIVGEM